MPKIDDPDLTDPPAKSDAATHRSALAFACFGSGYISGLLTLLFVSWFDSPAPKVRHLPGGGVSVSVPVMRPTTSFGDMVSQKAAELRAYEAANPFLSIFVEVQSFDSTTEIREAAEDAKRLSVRLGCGVNLHYRRKVLVVQETTTVEGIVAQYLKAVETDARNAAKD
jgi:hypothetical protein